MFRHLRSGRSSSVFEREAREYSSSSSSLLSSVKHNRARRRSNLVPVLMLSDFRCDIWLNHTCNYVPKNEACFVNPNSHRSSSSFCLEIRPSSLVSIIRSTIFGVNEAETESAWTQWRAETLLGARNKYLSVANAQGRLGPWFFSFPSAYLLMLLSIFVSLYLFVWERERERERLE